MAVPRGSRLLGPASRVERTIVHALSRSSQGRLGVTRVGLGGVGRKHPPAGWAHAASCLRAFHRCIAPATLGSVAASGTLRRMSLASRLSRRHHRALQQRAIALVVLASVLVACVFHNGASNGSPAPIPSVLEPGDVVAPSPAPGSSDQTIALARTKIKHIVFLTTAQYYAAGSGWAADHPGCHFCRGITR